MRLEPFEAAVPQERLDDLSRRLEVSRLAGLAGRRALDGGSGPGVPRAAGNPLALRVRLAAAGGPSQSSPPVPRRHRRAGGALHPRARQRSPAAAPRDHARLAGLGLRDAGADPAPHRPRGLRRRSARLLRRRRALASGLWLFRRAPNTGDGSGRRGRALARADDRRPGL